VREPSRSYPDDRFRTASPFVAAMKGVVLSSTLPRALSI